MNIWVIGLIILVLAMVVGPVMMFKPSRRDSYLAKLRQTAAQNGIRVRLVDLEINAKKQTLAEYSLAYSEKQQASTWLLVKQGFVHDVHFSGEWDWQDKTKHAPPELHGWIKQQLAESASDIFGFGATPVGVCLIWTERGLTIEEIIGKLGEIREKLQGV